MPILDNVLEEEVPTHLLICGDTKTGKSDYAAHAYLDGYHGIYIDGDNGGPTLMKILPKGSDARKRVIYIRTTRPYAFLRNFTDSFLSRWNLTKDEVFAKSSSEPDDVIIELRRNKIPPGFLLTADSWTAIILQAMKNAARVGNIDVESPDADMRKVYRGSGSGLTNMLEVLQKAPYNIIVQAHGGRYEIKERPKGNVRESSKESEMMIKETITVPVSSSNPHGHSMGKFFNEIGWLETNRAGAQILSFKRLYDRVGGGRYNGEGNPRVEFSFSRLFGTPVSYSEAQIAEFYREFRAEEFVAPVIPGTTKPAVVPAATQATGELPQAGVVGEAPRNGSLAALMQNRKK